MRVHVLLFGPLAEIFGVREESIELGTAPSVLDVYQHYWRRDPRIGKLQTSLHIAVNQSIVHANHKLSPEDEVALLPPVCGGSDAPGDLIDLVNVPLETYPWRSHFAGSSEKAGAVTSFEGLVRKDDENDPVRALAFDAYRPMAIGALHELAVEARKRWPLEKIVMLHRIGTVPAGQVCVVVAVSTGHREAAFQACKYLIDTLKTTVPIWKKELTASTSRWVEGVLLPNTPEQPPVAE